MKDLDAKNETEIFDMQKDDIRALCQRVEALERRMDERFDKMLSKLATMSSSAVHHHHPAENHSKGGRRQSTIPRAHSGFSKSKSPEQSAVSVFNPLTIEDEPSSAEFTSHQSMLLCPYNPVVSGQVHHRKRESHGNIDPTQAVVIEDVVETLSESGRSLSREDADEEDVPRTRRNRRGGARTSNIVHDLDEVAEHKRKHTWRTTTFNNNCVLVTAMDLIFITLSTLLAVDVLINLHPKSNSLSDTPVLYTVTVTILTELFTFMWMIVFSRVRTRKEEWEVVDNVKEVRTAYIKSSIFYVDLLYAIPLEFVFIKWANPAFYLFGLRHLFRIFRMLTLNKSSNPLLKSRFWFPFVFYTVVVVLSGHMMAMIFWSLEDNMDYLLSVYWTVTTLASVGYGDLLPNSDDSKIFASFVMIAGVVIVGSIIAVGTQFLTDKDPLQEDLEKRKRMMYSMLQYYDIPWDVQKEVIALFPTVLNTQSESQFKEVMNSMPQFVTEKIDGFMHAKLLRAVPLFSQLHSEHVIQIAVFLKQRFFSSGTYIIVEEDIGSEMFFLVNGAVEVILNAGGDNEQVVATLRNGSWFGEMAMLGTTKRTATILAVTSVETLLLEKTDFDYVVARVPELQKALESEMSLRQPPTQLDLK